MSNTVSPISELNLSECSEFALQVAKELGVDQAEVSSHQGTGVSVSVRQQELETVEKHNDAQIVVNVYKNHKTGSASSADFTQDGIRDTVKAAVSIASYTGSDECFGLAEKELMATDIKNLDLYHPWDLDIKQSTQLALETEQAALEFDKRIINSEGASLSSYSGSGAYANSHGFYSEDVGSQHSLSCSVIAESSNGMQRDYWYDSNRNPLLLESSNDIGRKASQRTIRRLDSRKVNSTKTNVLYDPMMAKSLFGHLLAAIKGGAIYKKASFMLDKVDHGVLPEFVTLSENPHLKGAARSSMYDNEGVATPEQRNIIVDGILQSYTLGSFTARKLGLETTANSGGVRNVRVSNTGQQFKQLLSDMGTGLFVTELIGSGINSVTGDYSRGAAGFWVENGEILYPVEEITIAGNLLDMYKNIQAIGTDTDERGNIHCGSILIENMTLAGS